MGYGRSITAPIVLVVLAVWIVAVANSKHNRGLARRYWWAVSIGIILFWFGGTGSGGGGPLALPREVVGAADDFFLGLVAIAAFIAYGISKG